MKDTFLFMTNESMGTMSEDKTLSYLNSQYVEQYKKSKQSIKLRQQWKTQGTGAKFMGVDNDLSHLDASRTFQHPTGICPTDDPRYFIYTIQVDEFFGMFSKRIDDKDEVEGHIMHDRNISMYDLDYHHANNKVVFSLGQDSLCRHLALLDPKTSKYRVLTEGDCLDAHPSWSKLEANTIVYDSCGIGIDGNGMPGNGMPAAYSEHNICRLNLDTCEIQEVVSFEGFDCIKPKEDAEGNIYFIRRPKAHSGGTINPVHMLINILLVPVKIVEVLFKLFNLFTMRYIGDNFFNDAKDGIKTKKKSEKEVFIEGNWIKVHKNEKANQRKGEKYAGIVPHNWELKKRTPAGEIISVKKGVLAFDIQKDGKIIYSNGKYIISLLSNQEEEKIADLPLVSYIKVIESHE